MTQVRPATGADVPAIVALEAESLGPDPWPEALVADGVRGAVPTVHYLVAVDDGRVDECVDARVVGHAVASVVGDLAELQRLAVTPACRRTGVATALLDAVAELASTAGADRLLLEVREHNEAARALYARHGFVEIDRRPRYYRDGTAAVILMLALGPVPAQAQ